MEVDFVRFLEDQGVAVALLFYMLYRQREQDAFMKEKFSKLFNHVMTESKNPDEEAKQ